MPAPRQPHRDTRAPRPLTSEKLRALALRYVGRYATSSGRLADYLKRKLRERGWEDEASLDLDALIASFVEAGYVNDAGFAAARRESLLRRGFGPPRVRQALRQAGVGEAIAMGESEIDEDRARQAAFDFAQRKRIGPYARHTADPRQTARAIAAMMRAGHNYALIREIMGSVSEDGG